MFISKPIGSLQVFEQRYNSELVELVNEFPQLVSFRFCPYIQAGNRTGMFLFCLFIANKDYKKAVVGRKPQ